MRAGDLATGKEAVALGTLARIATGACDILTLFEKSRGDHLIGGFGSSDTPRSITNV